jgi:hypothetical protein
LCVTQLKSLEVKLPAKEKSVMKKRVYFGNLARSRFCIRTFAIARNVVGIFTETVMVSLRHRQLAQCYLVLQ